MALLHTKTKENNVTTDDYALAADCYSRLVFVPKSSTYNFIGKNWLIPPRIMTTPTAKLTRRLQNISLSGKLHRRCNILEFAYRKRFIDCETTHKYSEKSILAIRTE